MVAICKICGSPVTVILKSTNEYRRWCSDKCMGKDPDILEKKKNTNLKNFGGHPMCNTAIVQQRKENCIEKYGCDNPFSSKEIQSKIKGRNLELYGCENPSNNEEVIAKIRKKAINRFSTVDSKNEILNKRKSMCIDTYGTEWSSQQHISADTILKMNDIEWLCEQHFTYKRSIASIAEELCISATPLLNRLSLYGITPNRFAFSTGEKELLSFVTQLTQHAIQSSNRNIIPPQEIDIYIPELNLALEYNGTFWHSELNGKNKQYHLKKTVDCKKQDIRLLQIFDFEWANKTEICKSRIRHYFGQSEKLFARKCSVKEIPNTVANKFLLENHIQGPYSSSVAAGLYYDQVLVAIATFSKSRYNKKIEWELLRYCSKLNLAVVGGCSKLFKWFIRLYKPKSVVSYADRRWSAGNLYKQIGFTFSHNSAPNYFYFNRNFPEELMSRVQFQKHKLQEKLKRFDANLTEWENMKNNGYDRVWDCGNMVFIWEAV